MRPRYLAPVLVLLAVLLALIPKNNLNLKLLRWWEYKPDEVVVVLPVDLSHGQRSLVHGAELAARVINNYPDKMAGKRIVLHAVNEPPFDDGAALAAAVDSSRSLAQRIIDRWRPLAVIGHDTSIGALTVASAYQRANVLFLSPFATDPTLTRINNNAVFSMIPNDREAALAAVRFLVGRDLRKVVVVNDLTAYGVLSGRLFADEFSKRCGEVIHRDTIPQDSLGGSLGDGPGGSSLETRVDQLLMAMTNNNVFDLRAVDAMVLYGLSDLSATLVRRMRYLNINIPVIGSDSITWITPDPQKGPGELKGVFGTSTYNPDSTDNLRAVFRRVYRETFGDDPDNEAAMGWDGIMLLNRAAKAAGSADYDSVSRELRALRYRGGFAGMAGSYDFSPDGETINKPLYVVEWTESGLRTALIHVPDNPLPNFCDMRPR